MTELLRRETGEPVTLGSVPLLKLQDDPRSREVFSRPSISDIRYQVRWWW